MAKKKLEGIIWPNLPNDTYILDAGKVEYHEADTFEEDTVGKALQNKAEVDGSYESMTVGNAEQLVSNVRVNDKTPYLFRTSGGSVDIGDREYVNGIVGGTVAWNQLWGNPNTTTSADVTFTNNGDGSSTINGTASGRAQYPSAYAGGMALHKDDKILFALKSISGTFSNNANVEFFISATTGSGTIYPLIWIVRSGVLEREAGIANVSADATLVQTTIDSTTTGTEFTNWKVIPQIYNLTQMFGKTIADYIYALEQATAGAGVAYFKKLFPKQYYERNKGELKSVSGLVSHDMTGFNQWDEEWRIGAFNSSGEFVTGYNFVCSKNPIKVLPNTAYSCTKNILRWEYDANMNLLVGASASTGGNTFTTTANTAYINFRTNYEATSYANDICINISWDGSRNGEYEPYEEHSYPLDSDLVLRGIPKLDTNNNLYYDGDMYEPDGAVTRKYGIVDMGSLTWYKYTSSTDYGTIFYTEDIASAVAKMVAIHSVCSKYVTYPNSYNGVIGTANSMPDKAMRIHNETGRVYVRDESISGTGADFKNSVNGVYLVYELATPTTETADPYQQTQIVNDFGTEEYVIGSNTFAVPVGSDTDYPVNLVAKLEMAPNSPDGSGDYIVRQTNGVNEYVPLVIEDALPQIPSTAGTYTLTVTVADGADPVLSWEA